MIRGSILFLSGLFWLVMMVKLYYKELVPYLQFNNAPSYKNAIGRYKVPTILKKKILLSNQQVGESVTYLFPKDNKYVMYTIAEFTSNIIPTIFKKWILNNSDKEIISKSWIILDENHELEEFQTNTIFMGTNLKIKALRYTQTNLLINYSFGSINGKHVLEVPEQLFLSNTLLGTLFEGKPYIGQKWIMKTIDFDFIKRGIILNNMYANVERQEKVMYKEFEPEFYRIDVKREPTSELPARTYWVDSSGEVRIEEFYLLNNDKYIFQFVLVDKDVLTAEKIEELYMELK